MLGLMLLPGYDLIKAAQVVAFFAMKEGGSINVLKLSKLVYLAERESMRLYDEPMFFDELVSMPDGPIASVTLNLTNGIISDTRWERFVGHRTGQMVSVKNSEICEEILDHLSQSDRQILDSLWRRFGNFDQYQIRDWTHVSTNVPEWVDPQGASQSIPFERVFSALGKEHSSDLASDVDSVRELAKRLSPAS